LFNLSFNRGIFIFTATGLLHRSHLRGKQYPVFFLKIKHGLQTLISKRTELLFFKILKTVNKYIALSQTVCRSTPPKAELGSRHSGTGSADRSYSYLLPTVFHSFNFLIIVLSSGKYFLYFFGKSFVN
jgi:hypothetical protein